MRLAGTRAPISICKAGSSPQPLSRSRTGGRAAEVRSRSGRSPGGLRETSGRSPRLLGGLPDFWEVSQTAGGSPRPLGGLREVSGRYLGGRMFCPRLGHDFEATDLVPSRLLGSRSRESPKWSGEFQRCASLEAPNRTPALLAHLSSLCTWLRCVALREGTPHRDHLSAKPAYNRDHVCARPWSRAGSC